jgi:hypothetical protein
MGGLCVSAIGGTCPIYDDRDRPGANRRKKAMNVRHEEADQRFGELLGIVQARTSFDMQEVSR